MNTTPTSSKTASDRRRGIALVIVLGFLALMVIMAVSFAVTMRTERLATRNYYYAAQAQQMALGAVAQGGIDGLVGPVGVSPYPLAVAYPCVGGQAIGIPNLFFNTASGYASAGTNEAIRYIPMSLLAPPFNAQLQAAQQSMTWSNIIMNNKMIGRISYLAVNCSGFIDPNFAGRSNRTYSATPCEIVLDQRLLPELDPSFFPPPPATPTPFTPTKYRSLFTDTTAPYFVRRFETHEDMWIVGLSNSVAAGRFLRYPPMHLFPFSWAPNYYFRGTPTGNSSGLFTKRTFIGGINPAGWNQANVERSFSDAGLDSIKNDLYNQLADLVDNDVIPRKPAAASCEPVPMLNEAHFNTAATPRTLTLELWCPYLNAPNNSYTVDGTVTPAPYAAVNFGPINAPSVAGMLNTPAALAAIPCPSVTGAVSSIRVQANVKFGGTVVDTIDITMPGSTPNAQCIDPRFNMRPVTDGTAWYLSTASSLGQINPAARRFGTGDYDLDFYMYCPNRLLVSVGELGYLPVSPWKTIRLYGPTLNPVMDKFSLSTASAVNGIVNPNSRFPNVIGSLYNDLPVEQYAGETAPAPSRLTPAQALLVGNAVVAYTQTRMFTNSADIGRVFDASTVNSFAPQARTNDFMRESLVRNVAQMIDMRQQIYTVFVIAQSVIDANNNRSFDANTDTVMSEARAVAIVWRDTYRENNQPNRPFIRTFRWLRN